jgi:hypothetical protein
MFFGVDHRDWPAKSRETRGDARLVLVQSDLKIIGMPDVIRAVAALKDVDKRHSTTMPSSAVILKRMSGFGALRLVNRPA